MKDLRDLIDFDDLDPPEQQRLQRVHDLLLQAGPPAELPPELTQPLTAPTAKVIDFPLLPKRRVGAAVLIAAAAAIAAFGGGYVFGHSKAKPAPLAVERVVQMHGRSALAVLKVGKRDSGGNWPMEMSVSGLPQQRQPGAYYELWLTQKGRPELPCGVFRVHDNTTNVRLSVPYSFEHASGWVVTEQIPGAPEPGPIVLRT